jgi:hypothetical protein
MRALWIGIGIGIAFVACGSGTKGPAPVEISGKTPAEAAAIAARAVCTREARCGRARIECMGSGAAGGSGSDAGFTSSCMATIVPIPYDDCYADASADIADLLTCAAPTADQIDMLEICFDMLAARACITQAEADALARASEAGNSPPDELPAACALLMNPPSGC